jgi:hypothetical protein
MMMMMMMMMMTVATKRLASKSPRHSEQVEAL